MGLHHDAVKCGLDHLEAINRTWIHLKNLPIRKSRFILDHSIEDTPIFDATSGIAATMISQLRVHAAEGGPRNQGIPSTSKLDLVVRKQEKSIRTGPESVVTNGAALARERKTKLTPPGGNCDINGHVHPNDT
ncbi:hypothetical protein TNCV_4952541 [Trichonephila clavipes]|nr:hypothetical protein TNCV_4952541 [Trichonephila clavipes]